MERPLSRSKNRLHLSKEGTAGAARVGGGGPLRVPVRSIQGFAREALPPRPATNIFGAVPMTGFSGYSPHRKQLADRPPSLTPEHKHKLAQIPAINSKAASRIQEVRHSESREQPSGGRAGAGGPPDSAALRAPPARE